MPESLEKVLNPSQSELTEPQKEVVEVFDKVNQEMSRLDRLSGMITDHIAGIARQSRQ